MINSPRFIRGARAFLLRGLFPLFAPRRSLSLRFQADFIAPRRIARGEDARRRAGGTAVGEFVGRPRNKFAESAGVAFPPQRDASRR